MLETTLCDEALLASLAGIEQRMVLTGGLMPIQLERVVELPVTYGAAKFWRFIGLVVASVFVELEFGGELLLAHTTVMHRWQLLARHGEAERWCGRISTRGCVRCRGKRNDFVPLMIVYRKLRLRRVHGHCQQR